MDDQAMLEVHSISELQRRGIPPTDDSFKFDYSAEADGNYSELSAIGCVNRTAKILPFSVSVGTGVVVWVAVCVRDTLCDACCLICALLV